MCVTLVPNLPCRILVGGSTPHRNTLARAFVNVFDAIRNLHAEYARVMNREAVGVLVDGIQCTGPYGATSVDVLTRQMLHGVCNRLLNHGCMSPVVLACLSTACFPKACKKYPTVWTGSVARTAGIVQHLPGWP